MGRVFCASMLIAAMLWSAWLMVPGFLDAQGSDKKAQADKPTKPSVVSPPPTFTEMEGKILLDFLGSISPEARGQASKIVERKGKLADDLLGTISEMKATIAQMRREDVEPEREQLYIKEKLKEVEMITLFDSSPIDRDKARKILADIFDIRQAVRKIDIDRMAQTLSLMKKGQDEREKIKDRILETKLKSLLDGGQPPEEW